MKNRIFILLLSSVALFSSCNEWLDVAPKDEVNEEMLFETGQGFRNALNGVYGDMGETSMYGREMTWGMLDVYARTYNKIGDPTTAYAKAFDCVMTDKDFKSLISGMWAASYTAIANCNNLIARTLEADERIFAKGEVEKNIILGEAYALRAFLHFDMLRLFAPTPEKADNRGYIPYFEKYASLSEPRLSVDSVLGRVERDLLRAKSLVGAYDTILENRGNLKVDIGLDGGINSENDIFFMYRGYRMNFFAITATLARMYDYAGQSEKAYRQAMEVINATYDGSNSCYKFTPDSPDITETPKYHHDVVFGLSNINLIENFSQYGPSGNSLRALKIDVNSIFGSTKLDYRGNLISQNISLKYQKHLGLEGVDDLIPMIRMSEMYYIASTYLVETNKKTEGIDPIDGAKLFNRVRLRRGYMEELPISGIEELKKEILVEARKEFIGEGQLFFFYKKYDTKPLVSGKPLDKLEFYFALPDGETIH